MTFLAPDERGALHRVAAHAPGAVDHHGLPGAHPGGVHRRAPAGRHAARDERGHVERDVLGDRDAGELGDHRVLRERAEHAQPAEVLAVSGGTGTSRRRTSPVPAFLPASHRFCRPVEQYRHEPQAGMNEQTRWSPTLTLVTPGPTASTTPAPSWPADDRDAHRRVALLDVVVGVAQPGRVELDPDLVGLRLVELELGDLPRQARRAADRGPGGHAQCGPLSRCAGGWRVTAASSAAGSTMTRPRWPRHTPFHFAEDCVIRGITPGPPDRGASPPGAPQPSAGGRRTARPVVAAPRPASATRKRLFPRCAPPC